MAIITKKTHTKDLLMKFILINVQMEEEERTFSSLDITPRKRTMIATLHEHTGKACQ